jgi:hypothetical protein
MEKSLPPHETTVDNDVNPSPPELKVGESESSPAQSELPPSLRDKVLSISKPLNSSRDIDHLERIEDIRNRSRKIKTVLSAWETQQKEERVLRRTYANYLLAALFLQILLINAAFFGIGLGYLAVEKWVATTFIMAVFFEVVALVLVIVKYLFPKVGSEVLNLIEKI